MSDSADEDAHNFEWVVALRMPPHNVGGLSLHQCPACCALVVEDFMPNHVEWHTRVTPPEVKSTPNPN